MMVVRHDSPPLPGEDPPNNVRVRRALNLLKPHLDAHVRQTLEGVPGARVSPTADVHELLNTMLAHPVHFFDGRSGKALRNCVHVLRESRNRGAHEQPFTEREARHAIDTVGILAEAIDAPRAVIEALDGLNAPLVPFPDTAVPPARAGIPAPSRSERSSSTSGSSASPRYEDDVIVNAGELTADDIAMKRVLCPACREKVFEEWAAGWDAHAEHRCKGLKSATPEERKEEFRERFGHLFRGPGGRATRSRQRDMMKRLWTLHAPDEERTIREYAEAERRGDVTRAKNTYGITREQYARRLLNDGLKKGWLPRYR